MCAIMEEYAKEYAEEYMKEHAEEYVDEAIRGKIENALKKEKEPQMIAEVLDVPLETVMEIKEQMLHN